MNGFNRFLVVAGGLKLAALAVAIAVLAWTIPQESIDWLGEAVAWLQEHNRDEEKIVLSAVAGGIALVVLVLVVFELWPRSSSEVKVTDLKVGDAVLSTAAVAHRVEEAVNQVPHVADGRAWVKAKRKGVIVSLDLHVDPDANLADVTDQACQAARDVLTERVHVALMAPPTARLHYRELRLRGGRPPLRQPVRQPVDPSLTPAMAGVASGGVDATSSQVTPSAPAEPDAVAAPAPEPKEGEAQA